MSRQNAIAAITVLASVVVLVFFVDRSVAQSTPSSCPSALQCLTCDTAGKNCLTCSPGLGLANNTTPVLCQACGTNCASCVTTTSPCPQCQGGGSGYGPNPTGNGCSPCSTVNCAGVCQVSGAGNCDLCLRGFGHDATGVCQPCAVPHCSICSHSGSSGCDVCVVGWSLFNNTCAQCAANCT